MKTAKVHATRVAVRCFAVECDPCGPLGLITGPTPADAARITRDECAEHLRHVHGADRTKFEETE